MAANQKTAPPAGGIARSLQRFFMNMHVSVYRWTGGAGAPGRNFLILTTIGRKSGQERHTPLFYFANRRRLAAVHS